MDLSNEVDWVGFTWYFPKILNIEMHGKGVMGEPDWGSPHPLNKILQRNIPRIFPIKHGILYMHVNCHPAPYIRVVPPKSCIIPSERKPSSPPSLRIYLDHHLSSTVGAHEWTVPSIVTIIYSKNSKFSLFCVSLCASAFLSTALCFLIVAHRRSQLGCSMAKLRDAQ